MKNERKKNYPLIFFWIIWWIEIFSSKASLAQILILYMWEFSIIILENSVKEKNAILLYLMQNNMNISLQITVFIFI